MKTKLSHKSFTILLSFCLSLLSYPTLYGQGQTKRALFLGNSYTGVNNLPQMVADVVNSTGNTLIFDSNTPGGYTFKGHSTNSTSLNKIAIGNWDYVILQEQSQYPSFPDSDVETEVFPYAYILDSLINLQNPCAETVFYMTWGRKNGDASNCASWPPVCTYEGMDSLLNLRYRMMADSNNAILSPVGEVWKYIRQNYPLIDLYQADESHPSVAGSYAAACCFYTTMFRNDPSNITFISTLSAADAAIIRAATKLVVYDNLMTWHVGEYDPIADFSYISSGVNQISFTNTSLNSTSYSWNFGDGDTSSLANPVHTYLASGGFTIQLISSKCGIHDTTNLTVNTTDIAPQNSNLLNVNIFPNPVKSILNLTYNIIGNLTYKILNILGEDLQTGMINSSETQIDVNSLIDGFYFLQLSDKNNIVGQQKFIKTTK